MNNDLNNDKEFPVDDINELKELLNKLDSNIEIPESIKPENIKLKSKKSIKLIKPLSIAASFVIFVSVFYGYSKFSKDNNINEPNLTAIKSEEKVKNNTSTNIKLEDNKEITSKYGVKSIDEIKNLYVELQSNNPYKYYIGGGLADKAEMLDGNTLGTSTSTAVAKPDSQLNVSNTNNQVKGVEEGDIVKSDGEYIYTIFKPILWNSTFKNSKVDIVNTLRSGEMKKISSFEVNGIASEMYLKDKKLIVVTEPENTYLKVETNESITTDEHDKILGEFYEENQGSDEERSMKVMEFQNKFKLQTKTSVYIYNVEDVKNPKLEREFSQEGYYLSSRLINDDLYLISNRFDYSVSYDTVSEPSINGLIPFTSDSALDGKNKDLDLGCITLAPNPGTFSYVIISGLNIKNNNPAKTEACLGGGNEVYASQNNLYVMSPEYKKESSDPNMIADRAYLSDNDTNIFKYSLENGDPKIVALGKVPGRILNQFSVDEYDGYFRVATTQGFPQGNNSEYTSKNNVYVLNSKLETVGKIENLAEGESIYSVRFMDHKGYVVTYKQVDPLFALDLSDPQNPKVTGELKIPGFSSYLHPYSENLLIGIGNETIDKGDFAMMQGLKLSLFDVSDPNEPKEIQSFVLGDRGTNSPVTNDHKALLFSKEKNIIGFPVMITDESKTPINAISKFGTTFNGYIIFNIDPEKGFTEKGRVTHLGYDPIYYGDFGYSNGINRGIFVDDTLYTISNNTVMASSLKDFREIQKVDLEK